MEIILHTTSKYWIKQFNWGQTFFIIVVWIKFLLKVTKNCEMFAWEKLFHNARQMVSFRFYKKLLARSLFQLSRSISFLSLFHFFSYSSFFCISQFISFSNFLFCPMIHVLPPSLLSHIFIFSFSLCFVSIVRILCFNNSFARFSLYRLTFFS